MATAVGRPAFASETATATLAENADGSSTAVEITELAVSGGMGSKSYTLVSVNGQTSGDDYDNFAVAAKTGSEATIGVVTYSGSGEDYEALKAALSSGEPTFALVIGVTDARGLRSSADSTLTVTVTDANDAPTFASQDPASPILLEKLGGDNADNTANTNDDPRLLATLTFADVDASDTSLTYSVVSVAPSSLGAGNFSVAAKSGSALEAELSFVGAATVVDYSSVQSFTVTVRAADGSAQVDQAVSVTVQENTAPTVSVAAMGTPTLQPNTPLTLNATVTDANIAAGDVLSYAWTVASASAGGATSDITLAPTDAASTSLTVPNVAVGATYGIQVLVTDLASQTATASYSLVVASDVAPAFGATVDAQSFAAQYGIEALQLPAATGGTGTVAYSLTGGRRQQQRYDGHADQQPARWSGLRQHGLQLHIPATVRRADGGGGGPVRHDLQGDRHRNPAQRRHLGLPADSRGERSAGVQRRRQSSGGSQLQLPDGHRHQRLGAARSRGWRRGAVVQPDGDGGHRCESLQQPAGWPVLQQRQQRP